MVKTQNFVEGDSTLATKAIWDDELTLIFCELCVIEVNVEWRLWRELLKESTCIGWCPSKKTVDATEEWWATKIQENHDFKGFKKKGIEPRLNELMWQMFGGIVATGENTWAPSFGVLPSGVPMGDDALNEGFGDSDEHSNENEGIPPDEVMDEFNNMYNSFDMNYDTPKLSEKAQQRIATIVTQVEHNNYHEEEEYVLSSVLVHHETYFIMQPRMDSNYTDTIKPTEGQFEEVPNHIRHDTRYWSHFKDCIGAIDGTHIKACISPSCQIPYIGRKEYPQMASFLGPYRGNGIIYLTFIEDFRQFENIPDMPVSSGYFDRGESSSSNSETDLEIAMLRETIATSLMNPYL
ncbi:hypothetical protein GOBAR_DD16388 [Gossypium barbadense]|nr:hypothetical protein GOBAR_DD16388 [Gossypium barbadense]